MFPCISLLADCNVKIFSDATGMPLNIRSYLIIMSSCVSCNLISKTLKCGDEDERYNSTAKSQGHVLSDLYSSFWIDASHIANEWALVLIWQPEDLKILYHGISYSISNGITDKHSLIWYDIISNLDSLLNLNFCAKNQIRFLRSQNFPQSLVPFPFLHYTLTSSPSHCEHWTLCPEEPFQELSFHLVTL